MVSLGVSEAIGLNSDRRIVPGRGLQDLGTASAIVVVQLEGRLSMSRTVRSLTAVALAVALWIPVVAEAAQWQRLGTRTVTDRVEHDEIVVGGDEGRFTALRLGARRSAVRVRRIVVHFGNGDEQVFEKNFTVPRGGRGPVLDLEGGKRVIRRVSFTYEAKSLGRRGAVMSLWGRR